MNKYYLFGKEAISSIREHGLEAFGKSPSPYMVYMWVDKVSQPSTLLTIYDGWNGFAEITEDQYNYLLNL